MNLFNKLLIFALISIVSSEMCSGVKGKNYDECKNLELPSGKQHCCYVFESYQYGDEKTLIEGCASFTEEQYNDLDSVIKKEKEKAEMDGGKFNELIIDCGQKKVVPVSNGNYIQISLFILSLLFLK